jgi:phytoene dehydrogenase-like protein
MTYDALVIGAGVNGLTAAHYLARGGKGGRGRRVMVLEQRPTEGFGVQVGWIPPQVIRELALERHGLRVERPDPWIVSPLPAGGGDRLELWQDLRRSADAIRRVSPTDAGRWPEFCARMSRLAGVLQVLLTTPAPDVESRDPAELFRLALLGWRVRRLGRQGIVDLLRILPMSVAELLDEWFESDALKGVLAAGAIAHLRQGPRSSGTAFTLLHHHVGSPPGVFRPPWSNVVAALASRPGIEIRRGVRVARIAVRAGRATGVVLEGGEELAAPVVVSAVDPRATLLGLLEPGWLDPELTNAVSNIKCRGVAARVTLPLREGGEGDAGFSSLAVAPSLEYLERAYDDAKYGRVSARPYIEARVEDGRIVAHVQYAPYALADGPWDEARRRALGEAVVGCLAGYVSAVRGTVDGCEVLTPKDLEDRYGLTEGHVYHGELTLDQVLFMRPVAGWSRYRTPISGLYLCSAGTHPGGAVLGVAGRLAARTILKESRS